MKKCQTCIICPYIVEGREVKNNIFRWKINSNVTCYSRNIVYLLSCTKENCIKKNKGKQLYIGETERSLKDRVCEHIGYINTKNRKQPAGEHFNLPGHSKSDMKVTILEKVHKHDPQYRKERESLLIRKFNTFYHGLNKKP